MKTATLKFKKNQQVKMTPLGYQMLAPGKTLTGTVVGFCRSPWSVQIRLDGYKTPFNYHVSFWCSIF
jgi:hypothetical protein